MEQNIILAVIVLSPYVAVYFRIKRNKANTSNPST